MSIAILDPELLPLPVAAPTPSAPPSPSPTGMPPPLAESPEPMNPPEPPVEQPEAKSETTPRAARVREKEKQTCLMDPPRNGAALSDAQLQRFTRLRDESVNGVSQPVQR